MLQRKKLTAMLLAGALVLGLCGTGAGEIRAADVDEVQASEQAEAPGEESKQEVTADVPENEDADVNGEVQPEVIGDPSVAEVAAQEKSETGESDIREVNSDHNFAVCSVSNVPYVTEIEFTDDTSNVTPGNALKGKITVKNAGTETIQVESICIDWENEGDLLDCESVSEWFGENPISITASGQKEIEFEVKTTEYAVSGKRSVYSLYVYLTGGPFIWIEKEDGDYKYYYNADDESQELEPSLKISDLENIGYTVAQNENADGKPLEVQKVEVGSGTYRPGAQVPITIYFSNETDKKAKFKEVEATFAKPGAVKNEDGWYNDEDTIYLWDSVEYNAKKIADGVYTCYLDLEESLPDGVYVLDSLRCRDMGNVSSEYKNTGITFTVKKVVVQPPVKVSGISLSAVSKKIAAGKKVKVTASVAPANAANKALTWTSSNTKYATVNSSGTVTFKKAGAGKSVTITATAADGSGKKASIKFSIKKHAVKSIKLKASKKKIKAGKSFKIKATIKTTGKKVNKKLKWTSSNTRYAKVSSSGKVKTYKAGKGKKVKITAMATDGSNKKKSITIKLR